MLPVVQSLSVDPELSGKLLSGESGLGAIVREGRRH